MALHINNQTKEERAAERAEWRKEQLADREFEKARDMEYQRREDLLSEREFWMNVFLSKIDEVSVDRATGLADDALSAYKARFS